MASQFKNRLVGITILVALVVIFLPSLIDGEKTSYQQEFVSTPIKPELKQHTKTVSNTPSIKQEKIVIENSKPNELENNKLNGAEWKVEEIAATVVIDEKQTQVTPTAVQTKKEPEKVNFTDPAWTIQLGAFENKANINTLLKKLNKAGFRAHTIPKVVMDGQLTRVFVGPDVSKGKLESNLPRLKSLTGLNGKLIPFSPIEP